MSPKKSGLTVVSNRKINQVFSNQTVFLKIHRKLSSVCYTYFLFDHRRKLFILFFVFVFVLFCFSSFQKSQFFTMICRNGITNQTRQIISRVGYFEKELSKGSYLKRIFSREVGSHAKQKHIITIYTNFTSKICFF